MRPPVTMRPIESLTVREESILRLMAEGKTNKAIADKLGFAEVTSRSTCKRLLPSSMLLTGRTRP